MSVPSKILKEAARRLTAICCDNGYSFDLSDGGIHLPFQDGEEYTPEHLTMIVTGPDEIPREPELDRPGNPPAIAYRMPVMVECILIPSRWQCEHTWDEMSSIVLTNISIAITISNAATWHQFGGLCINAEIQSPQYQRPENDGGIGSVKFIVDAFFRVSEINPTIIRG